MAGKGDAPRPNDKKKYDENFDKIKWKEDIDTLKELEKDN